jgi:hypothetical protein
LEHHQCFQRSAKICEPLDIEVKKPRICGRQIMRDNVEAESPEDYFRKVVLDGYSSAHFKALPMSSDLVEDLCKLE